MLPPEAPLTGRTDQHPDGPLRPLAVILAAAALAAAAGCGDDNTGQPSAPAHGKGTALELTLDADGPGGEKATTATVDCPDPPRPGPDELCGKALLLDPEDFEPVPADAACTELYGGPDTLTVTGTVDGEAVDGTFTRENGCEVDRFDNWSAVLHELFPGYEPGDSLQAP